ncbi:hypothetical protein J5X92_20385 [Alteromonas sp. K632G]|uniref:hypothetical protein n=1 Tax=Alteromonas sp. K632G TaxID=2820757 RepID=UPI001AD70C3C|nr:hypothetical protein [Alteromonas sp. K632G]MBO7924562.1 hypothetical protein [Alteromonas sp. K632G]
MKNADSSSDDKVDFHKVCLNVSRNVRKYSKNCKVKVSTAAQFAAYGKVFSENKISFEFLERIWSYDGNGLPPILSNEKRKIVAKLLNVEPYQLELFEDNNTSDFSGWAIAETPEDEEKQRLEYLSLISADIDSKDLEEIAVSIFNGAVNRRVDVTKFSIGMSAASITAVGLLSDKKIMDGFVDSVGLILIALLLLSVLLGVASIYNSIKIEESNLKLINVQLLNQSPILNESWTSKAWIYQPSTNMSEYIWGGHLLAFLIAYLIIFFAVLGKIFW